jgi:putative transposase
MPPVSTAGSRRRVFYGRRSRVQTTRIDFPGAIHHIITSHGNERRIIYRDDRDRVRFLEILEEVVILRRWILHAWVLMSNHLLIETPEVGLSRGMKKLNESCARWFNERHRRVGHLFQG